MSPRSLVDYLEFAAQTRGGHPAVVDAAGREISYMELHERSDALSRFLAGLGVGKGDRVGVVLPKGIPAVVSLFGIMKAGAAYVPVDFYGPDERGRAILDDCQVKAAIVDARAIGKTTGAVAPALAARIIVGETRGTSSLGVDRAVTFEQALATGGGRPQRGAGDDLAYILYTSGSTGIPKGVMLTHDNAVSFVEWCSRTFAPSPDDRFSSHAPFHFDLSVFDLYVSAKHGATMHLISEEQGKSPKDLASLIVDRQLTVWYSTPSILTLLLQFGGLADAEARWTPRLVLFAGEVFPVKHLRAVQRAWASAAFYNLYGPTETNVCTFARIPEGIPADRERPYPIGFTCDHCEALVLDDAEHPVDRGMEGLLYISGAPVFQGYWNRSVENAAAFLERDGRRWYNTGDVVRWDETDGFIYRGRRDRMVKRRGYRVELGEIERALYRHPSVREAAVVSVADADAGTRIVAYLACSGAVRPSIVELKGFCARELPGYMSPDRFIVGDGLPKTSTDKIDYQSLHRMAVRPAEAG